MKNRSKECGVRRREGVEYRFDVTCEQIELVVNSVSLERTIEFQDLFRTHLEQSIQEYLRDTAFVDVSALE